MSFSADMRYFPLGQAALLEFRLEGIVSLLTELSGRQTAGKYLIHTLVKDHMRFRRPERPDNRAKDTTGRSSVQLQVVILEARI